jgi:hypothetical protein
VCRPWVWTPDASFSLAAFLVKDTLRIKEAGGSAPPGFFARSARGITLLSKRAPDPLARIDHVVCLLIAGGMVAVIAEADALEELGKFPRLLVGQYNLDLDLFHHQFSGGWGARPLLPPIHRRTQDGLSSPVGFLGFCKADAAGGPVAAAEAAGSGFALEEPPLGRRAVCRAASTARAAKGWAGTQDCGVSRTFQRAPVLLLSVATDQHLRSSIPCWISSHAAGGHLNIAQIMRPAGGTLGHRPSAHNFLALCLSARLKAPFQGDGGLFG